MSKQSYKKLMTETSKQIGPIILEYLKPLKKENSELYEICSELLKKKIGAFDTRTYLMRVSFEICSGRKWTESIKHACAGVELELASMYYTNRVFDEKGGKKILSQPNNQFIAAMVTRDLASQALTKACSKCSYQTFVKIKGIFDEINKIFYMGQFLEVSWNLYTNKKIKFEWNNLLELYYRRNYAVNNSYFEKIALMGAILGGGTKKQTDALASFGKHYGMMLEIVNDMGDFVPPKYNKGTAEKLPQDAYSDIKHGKLTLPTIYCLFNGGKNEKKLVIEALTNKNIEQKKLIGITKMLVNNGSMGFCKKTAKDYAKKAKHSLKIFDASKRAPLSEMCIMGRTNRYYKALEKFQK